MVFTDISRFPNATLSAFGLPRIPLPYWRQSTRNGPAALFGYGSTTLAISWTPLYPPATNQASSQTPRPFLLLHLLESLVALVPALLPLLRMD
jgi:hypothetical protein